MFIKKDKDFSKKNDKKIWKLKNSLYLCTRNQK